MTELIADPKQTYALVVGIEKYAYSRLDVLGGGPVDDALKFAEWLSQKGVPSGNIELCLSPVDQNHHLVKKYQLKIQEAISRHWTYIIKEILSKKSGHLLYVFWAGHGLLTLEGERRLICANATQQNMHSLDVDSLLLFLASSQSQIPNQICLIEACANYDSEVRTALDGKKFPHDALRTNNQQFVLFAIKEGEVANVNAGTGYFSQTLRDVLAQEPLFPPDMDAVAEKVKQQLKVLDKSQQPTYWERRSFNGDRKFYDFQNIDWREVSREKLLQRQKLTTNPLTSEIYQVKDVYVPLGLVERKKQPQRQGDVSPEKGSEIYKETEITKKFEHDEFLKEVLRDSKSPKSGGKRIAIIGEPGAGKTTLLQTIADWVYREIDQAIVIWVSLADLQGQEVEQYLFNTWLTTVARKKGRAKTTEEFQDDFATQFSQGRVWLLLDGLDEMSTTSGNPLRNIALQFENGGSISQALIVLTCRVNLWDSSVNELNYFDTYRTLDFSYPEQVENFITRWFVKSESQRGSDLSQALKETGKERIQDLVKNPLRLTLLCLNWQLREGKLPDTQAGLYQQFVESFSDWKKDLFDTHLNPKQLYSELGKLAKEAIDTEATRFRLRQEFISNFLGEVDDKNSLLTLALKLGWLNRVGIDEGKPVYAFFHAAFQEYFAAKTINDWKFFLNHIPKNPSQGDYRIFEPQWRQTILLWLGREDLAKEQKQAFIEALIKFDDGCGQWSGKEQVNKGFYEYQAYFLAAAGIAEFKDFSQIDEIITQIIKLGFSYFLGPIKNEAWETLEKTERTKAIAALVQLLKSTDVSNESRWMATNSLRNIDPGNKQVIAPLLQLLKSTDYSNDTFMWATNSLRNIDPGNELVIAALVQLLKSTDVDDDTRKWATEILGKIGTGNEQAIAALLQLLKSTDTDDDTRSWAAESLEKIGMGNEQAIAALVELLKSTDVDEEIHRIAAKSLVEIGTGNEQAITALVDLLKSTDTDDDTRKEAVESLEKILQDGQFGDAVKALKDHLYESETFEYFYQVMWHCAQNMPYPDFYQAWHHDTPWWRRVELIDLIRDRWKKILHRH